MTYSVPAPDITASLPPQNLPPTLPQLNPMALSYMTTPYPVYSVLPPTETFGTTISNQASSHSSHSQPYQYPSNCNTSNQTWPLPQPQYCPITSINYGDPINGTTYVVPRFVSLPSDDTSASCSLTPPLKRFEIEDITEVDSPSPTDLSVPNSMENLEEEGSITSSDKAIPVLQKPKISIQAAIQEGVLESASGSSVVSLENTVLTSQVEHPPLGASALTQSGVPPPHTQTHLLTQINVHPTVPSEHHQPHVPMTSAVNQGPPPSQTYSATTISQYHPPTEHLIVSQDTPHAQIAGLSQEQMRVRSLSSTHHLPPSGSWSATEGSRMPLRQRSASMPYGMASTPVPGIQVLPPVPEMSGGSHQHSTTSMPELSFVGSPAHNLVSQGPGNVLAQLSSNQATLLTEAFVKFLSTMNRMLQEPAMRSLLDTLDTTLSDPASPPVSQSVVATASPRMSPTAAPSHEVCVFILNYHFGGPGFDLCIKPKFEESACLSQCPCA